MTVESDIAAIADGGDNPPSRVRTALTSVLDAIPETVQYLHRRLPGETPNADDDFFDDESKAFTEVTISGTAVWTESRGVASVVFDDQTAGDAAAALYSITSASAPMTIETWVETTIKSQQFPSLGLCFTDGTVAASNVAMLRLTLDTTGIFRLFSSAGTLTAYTSDLNREDVTRFASNAPWGMRLIWSAANTFKWQLSPDGVSWSNLGAATFAKTVTPTHFGMFVSSQGATEPSIASFNYFRVAAADLST